MTHRSGNNVNDQTSNITISNLRDKPALQNTVADRIWNAWSKDRGLSRDQVISSLESIIASDNEFTLVAHARDKFVGTVSMIASDMVERPNLTPWIADVWVDPEYRAHRMGASLVNAAEQLATERGASVLFLCCVPMLRSFYSGLGWTEIESNVGREQACIFKKSMLQTTSHA